MNFFNLGRTETCQEVMRGKWMIRVAKGLLRRNETVTMLRGSRVGQWWDAELAVKPTVGQPTQTLEVC